jgi:hypothetical protein
VTELDKLRDGNDLAARLLRAGSGEQPKHTARNRAERALGLSGVAAGALLTSKATAAVTLVSAGSGTRLAVPLFAKWLALGMLAGGAALGGASVIRDALEGTSAPAGRSSAPLAPRRVPETAQAHPQVASTPVASSTAASAADDPRANGATSSSAEPQRTLSVSSGHLTAQPPAAGAEWPPQNGDALLSREVELLEHVRAKLRAGNSGAALAELNAIGGEIRSLTTEADLLRVEALLAHGERARAEALAEEMRRRGSGQNFRLKRLLGGP